MSIIRQIGDGLRNVVANIGTDRDKSTHSEYVASDLTMEQARNAYRGSWIPRKIVDIPAEDATRRWRSWNADKDQIIDIESEEKRLGLRLKTKQALQAARLYGGAAILIGTGEEDTHEKLDLDRIDLGGVEFLTVLDRRDLVPDQIVYTPSSPYFGLPEFYDLSTASGDRMTIHASRLALFRGARLPDSGSARVHPWGDSVLQAPWTSVKDTDGLMANVASLVFEAKVDTIGIPSLTQSLSSDPRAEAAIIERISLMQKSKSVVNAVIHDTEEVIGQKQIQFGQLPEIIDRFFQIVSGAANIPTTRFFGMSPAGMNATGESDLRNYYDLVQELQQSQVEPALSMLDEALIRSALGDRPDEVHFNWRPLWQLSEKERVEVASRTVATGSLLRKMINPEAASVATTNALIEIGAMPGLEAAIEEHGIEMDEPDEDEALEASLLPEQKQTGDAAPKTLYVRRDVLNRDEILEWARDQGFKTTLEADDLHVTIAYSRRKVDWMRVPEPWSATIELDQGGPRVMDLFGEARALLFRSGELEYRHREFERAGATWNHPEYQPHITISYGEDSPEIDEIEPYRGRILLGPEIFEEVEEA